MNEPVYTITRESITLVLDGTTHTVRKGAANFEGLRSALLSENWPAIPGLLTVASAIEKWAHGDFTVKEEQVLYRGDPLPEELNQRLIQMVTAGEDPTSLVRFWERLLKNPSYRSVQQLFAFLAQEGIPIDKDGTILAYKSIRPDYMDWYSGTVSNTIGAVLEMSRNKISDDPHHACHYGFHVGALAYATAFGGEDKRIIIVRVDPEDVVCVPYDCSQQKMRVCRYAVVGHYGEQLPSTTFDSTEEPETQVSPYWEEQYQALDKMTSLELLTEHLETLRKYAANHLKIVGASKIRGGKVALLQAILNARG
jgi:hypothetical protein